jgi:hypothetical protein
MPENRRSLGVAVLLPGDGDVTEEIDVSALKPALQILKDSPHIAGIPMAALHHDIQAMSFVI